jgi:hypothetical protein
MRKSKRNITKRNKIKINIKTVSRTTKKSKKCVYTDEAKRIILATKSLKKNRTNKKP